jgi:hypothetical protein
MTEQSTALRLAEYLTGLADEIDHTHYTDDVRLSAAELRRLHAVNQELLEALKRIELACTGTWVNKDWVVKECSAAIAKAEGKV